MAMTKTATATLAVSSVASATAVCGAIYTGISGNETPWNDGIGVPWVITTTSVLLTALYGLLAFLLARSGAAIDHGSRPVRVVRMLMVVDLAALAAVFAIGVVARGYDGPLAAAAGGAFLFAFLLGAILGALLLRHRQERIPALLMLAPLAILPITALIGQRFPDWADPAYAEATLYLGLALLGAHGQTAPTRPLTVAQAH
jgi:hypothetical protein